MNSIVQTSHQQITSDVIVATMSGYADRTKEAYASQLARYLNWARETGNMRLDAICVSLYIAEMEDAGAGASSLNQFISVIKEVSKRAWMARLLPPDEKDRILAIPLLRQESGNVGTWLTPEQVLAMYEHIKAGGVENARVAVDAAVFALMVGCGLRVSEVEALEFRDLTTYAGHPALVIRDSKGGKSRYAIMADVARDAIANWLTASRIVGGPLIRQVHKSGSILPKGVTRQALHQNIKRVTKDAFNSVPSLRLVGSMEDGLATHNLRRTYALILAQKGVPLETIQKLLGHSSLSTTRMYLGNHEGIAPYIGLMDILP